ncbi:unnamed protein product [marine sediment metagenome]|uniref:Uncharacterized protein n=1 Tax=marine sediment metagenome TaxID=412755 RepID=X1P6N5_9ZZZZ
MEKTDVRGTNEVLKGLGLFSKRALILTGFSLIISILMLSLGNSVNYHPVLFWAFGVLIPIIVISILLWFVYALIGAITMGLAGEAAPSGGKSRKSAGKLEKG